MVYPGSRSEPPQGLSPANAFLQRWGRRARTEPVVGDFSAAPIQFRDDSRVFGNVEAGLTLAPPRLTLREDGLGEPELGLGKQISQERKLLYRVKIRVIGETNGRPRTSRIRLEPH